MEIGILNFEHLKNDMSRKIIHIDMDAFYASVEMRDNPKLKDKPVVMATHPKLTNGRGIVSTCNYKAREYGIRSAMSSQKAFELCPHAEFIPVNISYYAEISKQIREIFKRYTDVIEPLSLDEAYLDVTDNKINAKSAMYIAKCIQRDIFKELQLTCSAGVSYNKFLAKVASDFKKPSGLTTITPENAEYFLMDLPIAKFYGIGKKSVEKLHEIGIFYGKDVYTVNAKTIVDKFGRQGFMLLQRVRGIDNSPVQPTRQRKSLGRERTYYPELASEQQVQISIRQLANSVSKQLKRAGMKGNVVTLKIRYSNFETVTRQKKLDKWVDDESLIFQQAIELFEDYGELNQTIRLMGVSISGLEKQSREEVSLL